MQYVILVVSYLAKKSIVSVVDKFYSNVTFAKWSGSFYRMTQSHAAVITSNVQCVRIAAGRRNQAGDPTTSGAIYEMLRQFALTCGSKQPGLDSSRLRCFGCPSRGGLSTSTIHYNQPAEAGDRH